MRKFKFMFILVAILAFIACEVEINETNFYYGTWEITMNDDTIKTYTFNENSNVKVTYNSNNDFSFFAEKMDIVRENNKLVFVIIKDQEEFAYEINFDNFPENQDEIGAYINAKKVVWTNVNGEVTTFNKL